MAFKLSEKELNAKIEEYKAKVDADEIPRASWANFCAYLGYTEAEATEVVSRGDEFKRYIWWKQQKYKLTAYLQAIRTSKEWQWLGGLCSFLKRC